MADRVGVNQSGSEAAPRLDETFWVTILAISFLARVGALLAGLFSLTCNNPR
jgi:hypothetical protein